MPKKKKTSQQKVDLTERPAQGGGAQRRESAQSDTGFGTDRLFDDDPQATHKGAATPNPEHRRPRTIKSMKHFVVKRIKVSSSSNPEDTSDARGSNSGTEQIPSSPVMTLKSSPQSPTSSDEVSTNLSETFSHLPLDDTSPRLQEEVNQSVGTLGFTPTKEPKAGGLYRAAQRSLGSGAPGLSKQIALKNKLKREVEDLEKKLKAKEDESKELKAKLDRRDIEHQNHLDTTLKELTEAHQIEMEKKEVSFRHARKPHQMIADINLEKDSLKTELAAQQQRVRDLQHELDHQKEQYGQLEIQSMAKQQLSLSLSPTDSEGDELVDQQDNRTDAEKLRDELEKVTKKAEEDAVTHRQQTKDLQAQVEDLTQRLNKVTASNVELQEVVKIAIEQAPPSAGGIQAGDEGDSTKLLQHIRSKYLEKVTEIVELKQRFDRKMNDLTEKIHEKDRQLKAQRDSRVVLPPTSSVDNDADEDEESTSIAELKATLRTKDKEILSLSIQLQTFQQVASQRQQLQEHSKTQSTVVVQLKKELAGAQEELRIVRDLSEAATKISELHQIIIERNEELRDLKKLKTDVEDDLNILKQKCEAEQRNHNSVKRDFARSQSVLSSLKDKSTHRVGAEEDLQEIQILTAEVNLYKIDVKEHDKKVERLNNRVTELGKANLSLKRRLRESNEERDVLALQNVELRTSKHIYEGQLDKSQKSKVDLTQLADITVSKTDENDQLQDKIMELKEELELAKFEESLLFI